MADTANNPFPSPDEDRFHDETLAEHFIDWVRTELVWYAGSFTFHLFALSILLLLPNLGGNSDQGDAPTLLGKADQEVDKSDADFDRPASTDLPIGDIEENPRVDFHVDPAPRWFGHAGDIPEPPRYTRSSEPKDERIAGSPGGGAGSGFGAGPAWTGNASIDARPGPGTGVLPGFAPKTRTDRIDGPPLSQHAVNLALAWLARHQLSDGSWSLQDYIRACSDRTCTGPGSVWADAGATALGLLPFLAIGQTHKSHGPYKAQVLRGVQWLIRQQQADGNLAKGAQQMMYSHGLATIALCETYGLSGDKQVGMAAQGAVNFILSAQNTADGGWRYNPNDPGDTSVVGWQLMALTSARMAGLNAGGSAFSAAGKWLDAVAVHDGAEYAYQPGNPSSSAMTSVGLLCRQYLGARRDNPMLSGGMEYLMNRLPDDGFPNIYYWYYGTQVMHNMGGPKWDIWNRKIRNLLVQTQLRDHDACAHGSWPPEKDPWGKSGGRLMTTSLSTLTLEVYYRYLPLFKTDESDRGMAR